MASETEHHTSWNGTGQDIENDITLSDGTQLRDLFTSGQTGPGELGTEYTVGSGGTLLGGTPVFQWQDPFTPIGQFSSLVSLQSATNSAVGLDTATGTISNVYLPTLVVAPFTGATNEQLLSGEMANTAAGGVALGGGDFVVVDPFVNTDGAYNNSPAGILTGYLRPGAQALQDETQNLSDLLHFSSEDAFDGFTSLSDLLNSANAANGSSHFLNIDPLMIDVSGKGIQLSNWINNAVYFQSNVNGSGVSDGKLHHTSWMQAGTGILAIDRNGNGVIDDITETLSQFFQGGSTPGAYADGLAALANLTTTGATSFNATTAKIDPTTSVSYFNEVKVWQDSNLNGVTDSGELQSLSALGITSISLVGSGNLGESIAGSAVTNRTSYTKSDGSTGAVAAVNLQTDTTGDVTYTASGGVIITSTPEGGASATNSYVDQNTSAQSYTLSGGVLTDTTTSTVIGSGLTAYFATTKNDTITVSSTDTTSYWLGGGIGAATLTGGAGNTTFLINHQTIVHGGTGFNIAQVMDAGPITVDLKTANLQEVIGGAGNGVFNASGTTWNVFIQGGSGNNIIIGGAAHDALSGGTGDDLIEGGSGGSVIHAGLGNDVIYGGSGTTSGAPNSDVIYGGAGNDTVILGTNNSDVFAGTGSMTVMGNSAGFSIVSFHGSYADYTLRRNGDGSTTVTEKNPGRDGSVTFKNVTALDFADINQLPVNLAAGLPVNDTINVAASGPYTILTASLLKNDIDYAGNALSISSLVDNSGAAINLGHSGSVNGGTAALSADGSTITFTPTPGFTGLYSFRYNLQGGAQVQQISAGGTPTGVMVPMTATVTLLTPADPTDPGLAKQWYLQAIDILPAWQAGYTGAGVSIGVFDPSGNIDFSNPDLAANEGGEFTSSGAPGIQQIGTHATLVAGVIGAARDGAGQVGVAYDATLSSEAMPNTITTGSDAVLNDWANYDVVNNSWGTSPPFADNFETHSDYAGYFAHAATSGRGGLGTILVFSGGNDRAVGGNTNYSNTSNSRYAITVGGINAPSDLGSLQISGAPFSNPGASILVSAPANNIATTGTVLTNNYGQQFGGTSQVVAGTSLAAPIVSGVVALMLEANPNLGYRDVQAILADTATKVDPTEMSPYNASVSGWAFNGAANWNGGGMHTSDDYGFGEVDAAAAVRLAKSWTATDKASNESGLDLVGTAHGYSTDSYGSILTATTTPYVDFNVPTAYSGFNIKAEHIGVRVVLNQVRLGDITMTLVAADGTSSVLLNRPTVADGLTNAETPSNYDFTFDTTKDWNELGNQDYHLVVSYASGTTPVGEIVGAEIDVYGAFTSSGNNTYIYTDEFGQLSSDPNNAARGTLTNTGTGLVINASAVSTGTVIDLRPGSSDSMIAGRSLTISSNTTITTAYGGNGNSMFIGNSSADHLNGEGTNNTVSYAYSSAGVTVNLATGINTGGDAQGDTLTNIQNLTGSAYNDTLTGDANDNVIEGGTGADVINGGAGVNTASYAHAPQGATNRLLYSEQLNNAAWYAQTVSISANSVTDPNGTTTAEKITPTTSSVNPGMFQAYTFVTGNAYTISVYAKADGYSWLGLEFGNYASTDGAYFNLSNGTVGNVASGTSNATITSVGNGWYRVSMTRVIGSADAGYFGAEVHSANGETSHAGNGTSGIDLWGAQISDGSTLQSYVPTTSSAVVGSGVTVNLATGVNTGSDAQGDTLTNIQNLIGSAYNDTLTGDANNNVIEGGAGADAIDGGSGNNTASYAHAPQGTVTNRLLYSEQLNNAAWYAQTVTVSANSVTDPNGTTTAEKITPTTSSGNAGMFQAYTFVTGQAYTISVYAKADGYNWLGLEFGNYASTDGAYFNLSNGTVGNVASGTSNATITSAGNGWYRVSITRTFGSADYGDFGAEVHSANGETSHAGNGTSGIDLWGAQISDGSTLQSYVSTTNTPVNGGGVTVNLATGVNTGSDAQGDTLTNIQNLIGSAYDDTLTGDANNNVIEGGAGADAIDGGSGNNTASYAGSSAAVTVNLTTGINTGGDAQGDTLTNIQNLIGSVYNDTLTGDANNNILTGNGGSNMLIGSGGSDHYVVGAGDQVDTIVNGVSSNNTAQGEIDFQGGINASNLWFSQSGNDLVIDVLGTTQQTVVSNWYADTYAQTSEIVSGDSLKIDSSLASLVSAMASFSAANTGFNPTSTTHTSLSDSSFYNGTLATAYSSAWHS